MSELGATSLHGRVESIGGTLMLRIPLDSGGEELAPYCKPISQIEDGLLIVPIQPWLAERLRIGDGSWVYVDNEGGKFTITRSERNDEPIETDCDGTFE